MHFMCSDYWRLAGVRDEEEQGQMENQGTFMLAYYVQDEEAFKYS